MRVYTIQMSKWRLVKEKEGLEFCDITVKSGKEFKFLSPTWEMVSQYKAGTMTEEEYTRRYYSLLRQAYRKDPQQFIDFITKHEYVALACYCPAGEFCHRLLAVKILESVAKAHGITFEYLGELT